MHPLVIALLVFASFGGGLFIGFSVRDTQVKSEAGLKKLLAQEREKGRLEGSDGRGHLEPPKPWNETEH